MGITYVFDNAILGSLDDTSIDEVQYRYLRLNTARYSMLKW